MTYEFIKFTGTYIRGDNKISIQKSGTIRLSAGFCHETGALKYKYAFVYYDQKNHAFAIRFDDKSEPGALTVTKDKNSASIALKTFFLANKLNIDELTGRYNWKKITDNNFGDLYVVEIN